MIYEYKNSFPRWINFENKTAEKSGGGKSNNGAKGHAWGEHFYKDEEKVLCAFYGSGIVRRIHFQTESV